MSNYETKHTAKIHISTEGHFTKIEYDGKEVDNAVHFALEQRAGEAAILRLDLLAKTEIVGDLDTIVCGPLLNGRIRDYFKD